MWIYCKTLSCNTNETIIYISCIKCNYLHLISYKQSTESFLIIWTLNIKWQASRLMQSRFNFWFTIGFKHNSFVVYSLEFNNASLRTCNKNQSIIVESFLMNFLCFCSNTWKIYLLFLFDVISQSALVLRSDYFE